MSFARVIAAGGVAVFPADTVYGLACDPANTAAVDRLYALKGRPADKPAAVMFFDRDAALDGLPPRTRALLEKLLPGGLTALLPNPAHRFPLACGPDPETLGLRVPDLPALAGAPPVLQSSANVAGGPDARRLEDVPRAIREGADLVLDGGELPGTPSTVLDLRGYEDTGAWTIVRHAAISAACATRSYDDHLALAREAGTCERALERAFKGKDVALVARTVAGRVAIDADKAVVDMVQRGAKRTRLRLYAVREGGKWLLQDP